jgi:hypothetical protein
MGTQAGAPPPLAALKVCVIRMTLKPSIIACLGFLSYLAFLKIHFYHLKHDLLFADDRHPGTWHKPGTDGRQV